MSVNPYEVPNVTATETTSPQTPSSPTRKHLEAATVVMITMFLAGSWAGVPYLSNSYLIALAVTALAVATGAILYAVVAKRYGVLLALPLFVLAVLGRELVASMFFLMGFLAAPMAALFSLFRRTRENWLITAQAALAAGTAIASIFLYGQLQSLGAHRAVARGGIIVDAIHRYESSEGKLPSTLDDLVPRELESIPETGMIGFPFFEYVGPADEEAEKEEHLFTTYELRVNLYELLQFDCLVYWPEGSYPEVMYGGGVQRIEDWAYVHE